MLGGLMVKICRIVVCLCILAVKLVSDTHLEHLAVIHVVTVIITVLLRVFFCLYSEPKLTVNLKPAKLIAVC